MKPFQRVPSEQRPSGERDRFDARHGAQMFGHLIPDDRRLRALRDRIESEKPFGGEAGGLIRQPVERGDKQAGDEEHEKTERDLHGDQRMHQAAPRVRIFAAFERARRLDGRGAQRGRQTEQQRHAEGQRQAESQHAPVRRKRQARRIVRRIDPADDERRGPPGEQRAHRGREEGEPGAFHQHQLHQPPSSRADGDAQRHFARPRRGLSRHQVGDVGARDQQHQRHQHAESQRASGGSRSAGRRRRRPRVPARASG